MPLSLTLQVSFAFLFGLAFGSFGTMLLYRIPRNASILGRSMCTKCNHTLSWRDLMPLLSFFLNKGRCRFCHEAISWRYPFIETTTALLFVLVIVRFSEQNLAVNLLLALSGYFLILIALYDFETQKIPDIFIIGLFLSAFLYQSALSVLGSEFVPQHAFFGAMIPFSFFGFLWILSAKRWIGSGDILVGAAVGLLLGMRLALIGLFFTYVLGALAAIILMVLRRVHVGSAIPFAPFISSGTLLALFVGEACIAQYQQLLF